MGRFDGVLLASDFDNTLVYTEDVLLSGGVLPPLSRENREAIEYFMAEGDIFSVATGRALPSFAPIAPTLPMNGPTILFNGAAIYDFARKEYLVTAFLPDDIRAKLAPVEEVFSGLTCEIYHEGSDIHILHPNELTRNHMRLTNSTAVELTSILQVPTPISKVLFEETGQRGEALEQYVRSQPWAGEFEIVKSGKFFLEITAKGATKGGMIRRLAEHLHIRQENVCCVGDHLNDIPMLRFASHAFAPRNAVEAVRQTPGVQLLRDCREDAVAELVARLEEIYPPEKV